MSTEAAFHQATSLHRSGRLREAAALYDEVLGQFPNHADTLNMRGLVELQTAAYEAALTYFERAIAIAPRLVAAHTNRSAALIGLERYGDAARSAAQALDIDPQLASAASNLATAFNRLERWQDAIVATEAFAASSSAEPQLLHARADAFDRLGKGDQAQASRAEAFAAETFANLADRNLAAALSSSDEAVATGARNFNVQFARATVLRGLGRWDEALAACNAALEINPDSARGYALRGLIFKEVNQLERSLADLEVALEIDPSIELIHGEAIQVALLSCEWEGFQKKVDELLQRLDADQLVVQPHVLTFLPSSPAQQLKAASHYFVHNNPLVTGRIGRGEARGDKVRIGYFSSDFHDHPTTQLMTDILNAHDRSRFEVFAYAFGGVTDSPMRSRLANVCDRFTDVFAKSDAEIAELARANGIDIAVDLNGYTALSRPGIFAAGAAPLQVNYLGYPGTLGTSRYDYLIGDAIVTPPEHYAYFAEKIIAMPHSYQPNTSATRQAAVRKLDRQEAGLPSEGFVFCCFNSVNRITPDVFESWMRILNGVEGSLLWLLEGAPVATRNLKREAVRQGVSRDRIIIAPRAPVGTYLARYAHADIFLDTFYYNGHTTGSDSLVMGVPVVTRCGEAFASRVGASLLTAVGLPELITGDTAEYERLALNLARNPNLLSGIRSKLANNLTSAPLFDAVRYTRNLERAFGAMWRRRSAGLPPDHIVVLEES